MENTQKFLKGELITNVIHLIRNNKGDIGRLNFILETLEKNKPLYNTDKKYLEKKLDKNFEIIIEEEAPKKEDIIPTIKNIMDSGIGDPGRLQYIIIMLQKNKPLYKSDKKYLDEKIHAFDKLFTEKIQKKQLIPIPHLEKIQEHYIESHEKPISSEKDKIISTLEIELEKSKSKIVQLEQIISEQKNKILILENKLAQYEDFEKNPSLKELGEQIKLEEGKLSHQKILENKIKEERIRLTQLIAYREEYEQKVNHEKNLLDKQVKFEKQKISVKDELVDKLNKQQKALEQMKAERDVILEQIKLEGDKIKPEIEKLKNELKELNDEYEKMTKNFKEEKDDLNRKIKDQKEKNKKAKSGKNNSNN